MQERHRQAITESVRALKALFPTQVKLVVVFGSVARGEAVPESDADLLVAYEGFADPYAALRELERAIEPICLEHGVTVSLTPVPLSDYLSRKYNPFLLNVRREGVVVLESRVGG